MRSSIKLMVERDGETVALDPALVYRQLEGGRKLDGKLVAVSAPAEVIGLIRALPGEDVVDESGVVVSAFSSLGGIFLVVAICVAFAIGFKEGYEDGASGAPFGGEAAGEGEESGDGEGGEQRMRAVGSTS